MHFGDTLMKTTCRDRKVKKYASSCFKSKLSKTRDAETLGHSPDCSHTPGPWALGPQFWQTSRHMAQAELAFGILRCANEYIHLL
jgi:hypothetical protein